MTVPSIPFLMFSVVAAIIYNLSKSIGWRQLVLLLANLAFIVSFATHWQQLIPLAGFVAVGFVGAKLRARIGWASWALPILALALFVWLKRYTFVPPDLLLPQGYLLIGLSFVFFRVMHVAIYAWQQLPPGVSGLVSYLNYVLNFTSFVSGPIQRYDDYHRYETGNIPLGLIELGGAIERMATGFFKVYIVAGILGQFHGQLVETLASPGSGQDHIVTAGLAVFVYPLYLYLNFAGYTDFVIGVARLFRIELPENFDRPFSAGNIIDLWSRWHMTLTNWLKNYVYNPLLLVLFRYFTGKSARAAIGVLAYFVTFFLIGVWHGQTSEFLVFGLLNGLGVATNKLYQDRMISRLGRKGYTALSANFYYRALCRGLAFTWFAFTLIWFWSNWTMMGATLANLTLPGLALALAGTLIIAIVSLTLVELARTFAIRLGPAVQAFFASRYVRTSSATAMTLAILIVAFVLSAPAPEIVYKAF